MENIKKISSEGLQTDKGNKPYINLLPFVIKNILAKIWRTTLKKALLMTLLLAAFIYEKFP